MNKTLTIATTVTMCAAMYVGFDGDGYMHKTALVIGGWLMGWLFIVANTEMNQGE